MLLYIPRKEEDDVFIYGGKRIVPKYINKKVNKKIYKQGKQGRNSF